MADYTIHNVKIHEQDLNIIRSALISKETEEISLANSNYGEIRYFEHINNINRLKKIREQIEEIIK